MTDRDDTMNERRSQFERHLNTFDLDSNFVNIFQQLPRSCGLQLSSSWGIWPIFSSRRVKTCSCTSASTIAACMQHSFAEKKRSCSCNGRWKSPRPEKGEEKGSSALSWNPCRGTNVAVLALYCSGAGWWHGRTGKGVRESFGLRNSQEACAAKESV